MYTTVRLRPGIDIEQSPTLNSAGWSSSNLVRFFAGLPQPIGGWLHITTQPIIGVCREMHAWADLLGNPYIACGTNNRLQLFYGGTLVDITPLRATTKVATAFSTTIGSPTVTVHAVASGAEVGDWINIIIPVSVGGLILQGFYLINTLVDVDHFTVTAASNATANVTNGGAVPNYHVTNTQTNVTVALNNHGLAMGAIYTNQVVTTVGGITFGSYEAYNVASVTDANNFVIASGGVGTSTTTGFENGGNARIEYLIGSGFISPTPLFGYGIGPYGAGPYGLSDPGSSLLAPLRQWHLDNFGQILVGNYNGGPLYEWTPPYVQGAVALPITGTDVPQTVNVSFVSTPTQMMIALGDDPVGGGLQDPNLVRWCDVGDYSDWLATTSNQAGSYRIPSGSRIVGGIQGPQYVLVWTDIDLYMMQYLGAPLVWGFTKVASSCDLMAPNACGVSGSLVLWVGSNNFYMYDGNAVRSIPCPVWDWFFDNLDRSQSDKVFCAVNSWFSEATWYFPSLSGTGEVDSYVQYSIDQNVWTYGSLARTAWIDDNVYGAPIGVDLNGILQQHETSNSADGLLLPATIQSGFFSISDGSFFTYVDRAIADFVTDGGSQTVSYSIVVQDYPNGTTRTFGPYLWSPTGPPYSVIRARGRVAALKIQSVDVNAFWRLGALRYAGTTAGSR